MNKRSMTVKLNYRDRDLPSCWRRPRRPLPTSCFHPRKYRIEWAGDFQNEQRAEARFRIISPRHRTDDRAALCRIRVFRHVVLILGVVRWPRSGGWLHCMTTGTTLNVASGVASSPCSASPS